MSEDDQAIQRQTPESGIAKSKGEETNEIFMAQAMKIFGTQKHYSPTEAQVDKILAMQEKGMDYTHKERTELSPKQKIELVAVIVVVLVLLTVFIFSVFYAKEYLSEIITGLVAFLTGGAGGYGFAKGRGKGDED